MVERRAWLVARRKELTYTQQEVAELSKMQRSHYANIENGYRTPSVVAAKNIGAALNLDWLLFFKEKEDEQ